jgi:hypothetical protein
MRGVSALEKCQTLLVECVVHRKSGQKFTSNKRLICGPDGVTV